jgi:TrmH family RNA methyltransferase
MRHISSRQNPIVARFRELARGRGEPGLVLLDGEHLVEEAANAGVAIDTIAVAERRVVDSHGIVERIVRQGGDAIRVPDAVMAALSPVRQPSGVVAIARASAATLDDALAAAPQLIVVLTGIQDAGNVGAIVRAADGCGATAIICTEGTADPFGWKAMRGAMGSTFRVPIVVRQPLTAAVDALTTRGIAIVATIPRGGTPLPEARLRDPAAILLGGEGAGLPDAIVAGADARVTIPMRPPVESFNVAITAALILYEAAKQRSQR